MSRSSWRSSQTSHSRPEPRSADRPGCSSISRSPTRRGMNQRTIPGFEPSAESYAPAVRVLELGRQLLHSLGVTDQADFDIGTAIIDGMINQQLANDPGGTRWSALLEPRGRHLG